MKRLLLKTLSVLLSVLMLCPGQALARRSKTPQSPWQGRTVAFLGDSITDSRHVGTTKNYWQYLEQMLGLVPLVYGVNGHQWTGVMEQASRLCSEHGRDVDAIVVFAGTNDFNASVPLGQWYSFSRDSVKVSGGRTELRHRRTPVMDKTTLRGRINMVLSFLKDNFPEAQIILLTPLHRGYATFGPGNIQPDESWANELGLYIDDYVQVVREASQIWSVPVIDLYSQSGLSPLSAGHDRYFHNADTDMLHPNARGHCRIALTMAPAMNALAAGFRNLEE